nr:helix-turn-helix transcriptional regulator [uncultured Campylobacter sp.]
MQKWKEIKKELLKNSEVKAEFDKNDDELILDMIKARRSANLTQSQIAEKMGVSQSQIARIESNCVNIKYQTILKYLKICGKKIAVI